MKQRFGFLLALAAGGLWGAMGIFVRHFSQLGLNSLEIGEIRIFFGFCAVLLYLLLFHRESLAVRPKDLWCFACAGVVSILMLCYTYFKAMQYIPLSVAGVLLYTAPIFVTLFSAVLFRERITARKVLALILSFAGCALVCGLGSSLALPPLGLALGLGAGVFYSLYSIFSRYAILRGYGAWTITCYAFFFCILAGALFCDWRAIGAVLAQPTHLLWAVALGVCTAFAPYVLYSLSLERLSGSTASIFASVEPIVATLISVFLYQEPFSASMFTGIVLTLGSIVLLSTQKERTSA